MAVTGPSGGIRRAGALDIIGMTPDIPIPLDQVDPLAFAVRLIAAK